MLGFVSVVPQYWVAIIGIYLQPKNKGTSYTMDTTQISSLIEKLKTTGRCRSEVKEAAEFFASFGAADYETVMGHLMERVEGEALAILLNVAAINQIRLSPELLAQTLSVVEPITDFVVAFRMQDQTAIAPVLTMTKDPNLSSERLVFAARIATELTIRFDQDPKPVKKVLMKLSRLHLAFPANYLNAESLALLNMDDIPDDVPWLTQSDPLKLLPKQKPPVVVGGSYSVRRPVPKLGRNEPCHCGSGKKYKKCCLEKDQVLMRDASPYEGLTMTDLKSSPGLVDDPLLIEDMRASDLKNLDPATLGSNQLYVAFHRCSTFELFDQAVAMLVEVQGRPDVDFDPGHFEDLLDSALHANNLEAARKIRVHISDDQLMDPEETAFRFDLLEKPEKYQVLEKRCRKSLTGEPQEWDDSLLATSHDLEKVFPALSVVFSRAAIIGNPDSPLDQEGLLDVIQTARIELDLDPWGDPIEEYMEWLFEKNEMDLANDLQSKEIDELKDKVAQTKQLAARRLGDLKNKEQELARLTARLQNNEQKSSAGPQPVQQAADAPETDRQMIFKLRQRIENLKIDMSKGQQERRELREQVRQTMQQIDTQADKAPDGNDADGLTQVVDFEKGPQKIVFPEFTGQFRNSCKTVVGSLAAKALKAASGFAAHDRSIQRQTKALSALPSIYSTRIGIHHRLLMYWDKQHRLEVLDLIPRQQLETWIKLYRKKGAN